MNFDTLRAEGIDAFKEVVEQFAEGKTAMSLVERDGHYWPAVVTRDEPVMVLAIVMVPPRLARPDIGH